MPSAEIVGSADQVARYHSILSGLNTYRMLTFAHMRAIGVPGSQGTLSAATRMLHRLGLIGMREAIMIPRALTLPNLFWLRPRGAAALAQMDEGARHAMGSDRTLQDTHEILHRLGIVELHIALRKWAAAAGIEVTETRCDFDPGADGFGKATTIRDEARNLNFSPDLLAWVRLAPEETEELLVLELERGGERGDLSRFFKAEGSRGKLSYLRTLSAGRYVENALWKPERPIKRPRFLVVFKDDALRASALNRWNAAKFGPESPDWQWFFAKSLPETVADFGGGWHQPGDRPVRPLFKKLSA